MSKVGILIATLVGLVLIGLGLDFLTRPISVKVENPSWSVMICPHDQQNCQKGTVLFPTKEECEDFVKAAAKAQPNVGRSCHKTTDTWEIK